MALKVKVPNVPNSKLDFADVEWQRWFLQLLAAVQELQKQFP